MTKISREAVLPGDAPAKGVSKLFMAFCPELPAGFDLRGLARCTKTAVNQAAHLVCVAPVLFLPGWLWLCRFLLQKGAVSLFLAALAFGVAAFVTVDSWSKQPEGYGALKARPLTGGPNTTALVEGPRTSLQVCGTIRTPANPSSTSLPKTPSRKAITASATSLGSPPPTAVVPGRTGAVPPGSPNPAQLARLVVEVQALQEAVYGQQAAVVAGTPEAISAAIGGMCKELGHDFNPAFCSTYERMQFKIQELRRTVGVE